MYFNGLNRREDAAYTGCELHSSIAHDMQLCPCMVVYFSCNVEGNCWPSTHGACLIMVHFCVHHLKIKQQFEPCMHVNIKLFQVHSYFVKINLQDDCSEVPASVNC